MSRGSACTFIRIPENCIKDKGRFKPNELDAITSQDYNRRRELSPMDKLTVTNLYKLGKVMSRAFFSEP